MQLFGQLLANGLVVGSIYGLFALGFAFVFGVTRVFHLAQGAVYLLAAYTFYTLYASLELHAVPALVIASAVGVALGCFCEVALYRPLRRRRADEATTMVVALGMLIVVENLVAIVFGTQPLSYALGTIATSVEYLGVSLTIPQLQVVGAAAVVLLLSVLFTRYTRPGQEMEAVADNPDLAELVGISTRRTYLAAFVVGSVVAALSAMLVGRSTGIFPTMGFNPVLVGAVSVILAGNGRLLPAFGGGLFMGVLENLAVLALPSGWRPSVLFGVLVFALLLRPYGLFTSKERSFVQWSS